MTLADAYVASEPGDRLRHTDYQLILSRLDSYIETFRQMTKPQYHATDDDKWVVLQGKEKTGNETR